MAEYFNKQLGILDHGELAAAGSKAMRIAMAKKRVAVDDKQFSWTNAAYGRLVDGRPMRWAERYAVQASYRPFFRQWLAFDGQFVQQMNGLDEFFPHDESTNYTITIQQSGPALFTVLASDCVSDLNAHGAGNPTAIYARWIYAEKPEVVRAGASTKRERNSNINPSAVLAFSDATGEDVSEDDVFYYVYSVLQSNDFRETFDGELKSQGPRIPLPSNAGEFKVFVSAGRQLYKLHANFEIVEPWDIEELWSGGEPPSDENDPRWKVDKLIYPKIRVNGALVKDKTRFRYNDNLELVGIPLRAQDYTPGGRSALDWLEDRVKVVLDKESGLKNDPNHWGQEKGDPRYLIDLVKRVVAVSMQTLEIIDALPTPSFLSGVDDATESGG